MIKSELAKFFWSVVMITSWVCFTVALWLGIVIHYQYAIFSIAWILIFIIGAFIKAGKKE
jgi:hypothetical protein